jgi:outer membrane protein OmpA-like peptidoglycan-associated protein
MRGKSVILVVAASLILFGAASVMAQSDKTAVNKFYTELRTVVDAKKFSAWDIARMARDNPVAAEKCLAVLNQKAEEDASGSGGFKNLAAVLSDGILLNKKGQDCSVEVVGRLLERSEKQVNVEDKTLFLEKVIQVCPQTRQAYHKLGDLYLSDRRFGLAVATYEKALKFDNEADTVALLNEAKKQLAEYKQSGPITVASAESLLSSNLMAPAPGKLNREVQIRNALQTKRILFAPWSTKIDGDFKAELDTLGAVLKEKMKADSKVALLIEGHADQSGPEEKNLDVSEGRAKAIKEYLINNYQLDPERVQIKGYGFLKPLAPNDSDENRKLNRRVEFKKIDE